MSAAWGRNHASCTFLDGAKQYAALWSARLEMTRLTISMLLSISSAPPADGGLASGIVNTTYQVGSAFGLAVMTAIASAAGADQIGNATELTNGFSAAFTGAAAVTLFAGVIGLIWIRQAPPAAASSPEEVARTIAA